MGITLKMESQLQLGNMLHPIYVEIEKLTCVLQINQQKLYRTIKLSMHIMYLCICRFILVSNAFRDWGILCVWGTCLFYWGFPQLLEDGQIHALHGFIFVLFFHTKSPQLRSRLFTFIFCPCFLFMGIRFCESFQRSSN